MRVSDKRASDPSAPLSALVRAATHSRHVALHAAVPMRRLFAADYSVAEYRAHLGAMLGVVEPLERAAARSLDNRLAEHFVRRSERLCEDLCAMGASTTEIGLVPRSTEVPAMSQAGVRGYLYVALGSMLGGRLIARQLQSSLGSAASVRYYGDGAGRADSRWTAFRTELDAHAQIDADEICAAAIATFDVFAAWLVPQPVLDSVAC